ncbi:MULTISPECIES: DUF1345 domain-containing protein [Sphingomonas]|jgi:uncharacterized membrane protein|uniref:DUF1345 domain-containing protein n=1 Tax=Sphingomonas ginsenosidimutans TaxID=862134 RepID=A0A2A4HY48_9SPHN|nr:MULTISPECIES: DUF1345 domain-containing protein [Sphingomonas]MBY0302038.1 DUF1345 domain-containing protein [Sphingomonas ginsenosidimutans]PCG08923.1 DUF1345 domain-containing protein [Sphingomonas ginsenosidimutans]
MNDVRRWWGLGQRVAPPRFILFVIVFAVATPLLQGEVGTGRAVMGGFDIAAAIFLASMIPLFRHDDPVRMRRATRANDANRALLLAITGAVSLVILAAVHDELKGRNTGGAIAFVIVTLALAWLFSNLVYALHYAHLFYMSAPDGKDARGIDFPGTDTPDYWDFLYFSYTLGMTFQTSDVEITDGRVRRIVTGQCLAAFVFNLGVIAFSINVLGGG